MIKVSNEIDIVELDGADLSRVVANGARKTLRVESQGTSGTAAPKIVICVGEHRYTVLAQDLEAAVRNAVNTNRRDG